MKFWCVCAFFAALCEAPEGEETPACKSPALRLKVRLVPDDCVVLCDPDGNILILDIPDQLAVAGADKVCSCKLPSNVGTETNSIQPSGSSHYLFEVCDANTGEVLLQPTKVILDADGQYTEVEPGCVNIKEVISI